jgi:hypothetical protein
LIGGDQQSQLTEIRRQANLSRLISNWIGAKIKVLNLSGGHRWQHGMLNFLEVAIAIVGAKTRYRYCTIHIKRGILKLPTCCSMVLRMSAADGWLIADFEFFGL